jgi:Rps23 Pro-64 3,4-dihydroxylase Tpa1-like proline 4-hydroxylase
MFLSKYEKDDFLSVHHDIQKGDISVTCSLTEDWDVSWGGLLHFCNEEGVYKTISPKMGTLNVFKLDPENGLDHFVSMVNVNKPRYTFTAWYTIES